MKRILILFIGVMCAFMSAPAMADMFGFSLSNLSTTFNSGSNAFSSVDWSETTGDVYRNIAPTGTASFDEGQWDTGSEDFLVQMTISNITATTADGVGTLTLTDIDSDNVSADVKGLWTKVGGFALFGGMLSNVYYNQVTDTTFDAHSGDSVLMSFPSFPEPWSGAIVHLTSSGGWFDHDYTNAKGGSVDGAVLPVPTAVLLGMLGLGVAGWKLRKFA